MASWAHRQNASAHHPFLPNGKSTWISRGQVLDGAYLSTMMPASNTRLERARMRTSINFKRRWARRSGAGR